MTIIEQIKADIEAGTMKNELKELMKSALASYDAYGVGGSEGARAMRESLAHIEKLEAALLAADELAAACADQGGLSAPRIAAALTAFRAAVSGQ